VQDERETFTVPRGYSLTESMVMQRIGPFDPTAELSNRRFAKAGRTPEGPVTIELLHDPTTCSLRANAWGPGARWTLARVPDWLGASDRPELLRDVGAIAALARRSPGLRLGRSPFANDVHTSFVLQQRVTTRDAMKSHGQLVRRYGEAAPGSTKLMLFPDKRALSRIPSHAYFEIGLESRRARALYEAARVGERIQQWSSTIQSLREYLRKVPGTGVWTAENVMGFGFGDPDAVPIGDVHLPRIICRALDAERGWSDDRMLELLEPFAGQRFRVIRLLMLHGV
jgi:3-methyladenine DNA glycosylase/8-oxoguanine DNA glycosylase